MSEIAKTVAFIAAGAGFLGVAWLARPATAVREAFDDANQRFFAEFDPLDARSLEIVEFDEETATPHVFKVAHSTDGVWSIPSHEGYPADADNQLAEAAASVADLVKSPFASDSPADHELYGVVDPTSTEVLTSGVGTRVTMRDASERELADFIIGKEVKGSDQLRYVRVPGRDRVYTAAVDKSTLSTAFEDWIEDDLLQLRPTDVRQITVHDYSIDEVGQRLIQRDVLTLDYDADDNEWTLEDMSEGEELVTQKINDMKTALDDLKIVDVHRKPPGLSSELRAEDQLELDQAAIGSLRTRGFYIHQNRLISNEGEMAVGTKDGVLYTLRFGEIALGAPATGDDGSDGNNRYLFVTASFNPDLISAPIMAELPDIDLTSFIGADEMEDDGSQERIRQAMEDARAKVEAENLQRQADHEKLLETGHELVSELNDRFADWYYVISDDVYQKIRLGRPDLVTATETGTDEDAAADANG